MNLFDDSTYKNLRRNYGTNLKVIFNKYKSNLFYFSTISGFKIGVSLINTIFYKPCMAFDVYLLRNTSEKQMFSEVI